jgi:two-component system alkaline phosphatase synthesis response regulator PhoP
MSTRPKITIIDDDTDLVEAVRNFLARHSFEVSTAYGGIEGLKVIEENRPDLVILDMMMPDIDGIQVLLKIRGNSQIKDTSVIMLTAKEAQPDRVSALEMGAYEYIAKPLDTHMLLRQIENVLRKKKEGQI